MGLKLNETNDSPQITNLEDVKMSEETTSKFDSMMEDDDLPEETAYDKQLDIFEDEDNDNVEQSLEQTLEDYFKDLKDKSEVPETLPDKPFDVSDLKKLTPEENAEMREEFDEVKSDLKKAWEEKNGRLWPKYEEDVYSSNGKLIRKAGSDYDVHHIQPLGMGGKNEVDNITPLHAEVHYDKQGVHAKNSPYDKLDKNLGGID